MSTKAKIIGLILASSALVAGAWLFFSAQTESAFLQKYKTYAAAAAIHTNAAYVPAADANPVRQELDTTLARVLVDESMSDAERLALAEHGLDLLRQLEREIDGMGAAGEAAEAALLSLEEENTIVASETMTDIITLAKERAAIIADIRGLSYRANYHTAQILQNIVRDGGALTAAHVLALNEQTPIIEEQFNKRTNLYANLQSTSHKIDAIFTAMTGE